MGRDAARVHTACSVVRLSLVSILASALLPANAAAQSPAPAPASQSGPQVISCSSQKGQRQVCPADTAAGVALVRWTGETTCLLGKTWAMTTRVSGSWTAAAAAARQRSSVKDTYISLPSR
jgi:hypothetical protein